MIRSAVTISLTPEARGGAYIFCDDLPAACQAAAKFEFDAIEILPASADAVPTAALWKLLNEHDLKLAAVSTDAGWLQHHFTLTSADANQRQQARDLVRSMIDFAGPFGAPAIVGGMQGGFGDGTDRQSALGYLEDALGDLAQHAEQYRVPLLFEPLNRNETNLVNRAADATALVGRLASSNVRLVGDLFHLSLEEADLAAAVRQLGPLLGHLHLVDSNRRPAGCGLIDFAPVAATLEQVGFNGYASAAALPWPDPTSAAKQSMEAYKKYFVRR
jgi:sugar phosphate isomerase/epimerase